MRIILRIHKVQAHTWLSAFLRKQHCCLSFTSGTAYQKRHLQCYFYALQLLHLSEEQIGLLASPPTQALHSCIEESCGVWDVLDSRLNFKACFFLVLSSFWLPCQILSARCLGT